MELGGGGAALRVTVVTPKPDIPGFRLEVSVTFTWAEATPATAGMVTFTPRSVVVFCPCGIEIEVIADWLVGSTAEAVQPAVWDALSRVTAIV